MTGPARVYTCSGCGQSFPNFGALGSHRKASPECRAPKADAPKITRAPKRGIRIESMAGPSDPSPDGPALASPEPVRTAPSVAPTVVRITPEARAESTREAVAQALTAEVLADLLVSLSRALSEIDGAGEAGTLTKVQAAQIAVLLHDATVDLVIDRFKGDVTRFKAAMAILLIVLAKGAVHGRAIRDRLAERSARARSQATLDAATAEPEDGAASFARPDFARMSPDDQLRYNAG